ncbi:MAG: hypothetical protein AAF483_24855, partial [Planctomycetota bacterium]
LPIDQARLPVECEIDDKTLKHAEQIIGLLRFDAGKWCLQPLAVKLAKATIVAGEGIMDLRAKQKSKTFSILSERASKLLRG